MGEICMAENNVVSAQHDLIGNVSSVDTGHTNHPDAQWFSEAGLGLFLHWGLSSVEGKVDLSWGMMKNTPWDWFHLNFNKQCPAEYYAQADRFDPEAYDPDLWIAAAANAGVKYAVLTTKHHEGYALWPSKYGNLSTRTHMHGRDLLRPYVEACRRHGIKVGFYYSPPDWNYCREYRSWSFRPWRIDSDPITQECIDLGLVYGDATPLNDKWEPCAIKQADEAFIRGLYEYIRGQVTELLTQYGKIDLIWFDGRPDLLLYDENGEPQFPITKEEIRQLQPSIVINPRLHGVGDYLPPECEFPKEKPQCWWERCDIWNVGSWGYTSNEAYKPLDWMLELLAKQRAWEGNLLINCAPRPDGRMPETYYRRMEELAQWMKYGKEAVFDVEGNLWPEICSVPATQRGNVWYLFLTEEQVCAVVRGEKKTPKSVTVLHDGSEAAYHIGPNGDVIFTIGLHQQTEKLVVLRVEWEEE